MLAARLVEVWLVPAYSINLLFTLYFPALHQFLSKAHDKGAKWKARTRGIRSSPRESDTSKGRFDRKPFVSI